MEKEKDGVWRTIRGRRVFIRSGESLGSAMSRSGNFNRNDVQNAKKDLRFDDRIGKSHKFGDKSREDYFSNNRKGFIANKRKARKEFNKARAREDEDTYYSEMYNKTDASSQPKAINTKGKTRTERHFDNYSKAEQRELKHEELQKKLADYKAKKQSNIRDYKQEQKDLLEDMTKVPTDSLEDYRKTFNEQGKKKFVERIDKELARRKAREDSMSYEAYDKQTKQGINNLKDILKQSNNKISDEENKQDQKRLRSLAEKYQTASDDEKEKIKKEQEEIYSKYHKEKDYKLEKVADNKYMVKRNDLQSNNKVDKEYHFAGEELYSDDPHRYDDTIKSTQARKEKFKADDNFKKEKHIGWGSYNKDGVPVYENDIDYKGDFGWANLKTLSDDDLTKALNIQSEEYHKANAESVGDRRTRNGRMNKIFKDAKVGKYEQGMKKINEEMQKRNMPRYNIYDKKNPNNILVSSPTKEMADKQIQDMYKTDISLQKEYDWKELPRYDYRVGKVDENLNEIKETIKRYKQRKGK